MELALVVAIVLAEIVVMNAAVVVVMSMTTSFGFADGALYKTPLTATRASPARAVLLRVEPSRHRQSLRLQNVLEPAPPPLGCYKDANALKPQGLRAHLFHSILWCSLESFVLFPFE